MAHDQTRVREFARSYTAAWCSHDPARVADHFVTGGTIAINGGDPTEITEVAQSFVDAFPDIEVFMDDVVIEGEAVEYHWTFTGTNTGPGGTGKAVPISGSEAWTFGPRRRVEGHLRPGRVRPAAPARRAECEVGLYGRVRKSRLSVARCGGHSSRVTPAKVR